LNECEPAPPPTGGAADPSQKRQEAKQHSSKPQKNPEKNDRLAEAVAKRVGSNHIVRNRQFIFAPKTQYKLVADLPRQRAGRSEANHSI